MTPWQKAATADRRKVDLGEFPQRSTQNAWAVFSPTSSSKAGPGGGGLARRLLGPVAEEPWILINMTAYGDASLAEWGGGPFDFFTMVHVATVDKGATLVSLNTPESVLSQLYGAYEQPPPSIYWLTPDSPAAGLPEFTRSHFDSRDAEEEWWHRVIRHTTVDLHRLPPSFDPDTQAPPATFWKK